MVIEIVLKKKKAKCVIMEVKGRECLKRSQDCQMGQSTRVHYI